MARIGFVCVAIFAVLAAITFNEVFGIRCWDCTSTAAFCDDPFDENEVSNRERTWSYIECLPPNQNSDQRAVCKKVKQLVNDMPIISRSCFWEDVFEPKGACLNENAPSSVLTEFCETCDTDGCNGASQHGPMAVILVISLIAAKMALF